MVIKYALKTGNNSTSSVAGGGNYFNNVHRRVDGVSDDQHPAVSTRLRRGRTPYRQPVPRHRRDRLYRLVHPGIRRSLVGVAEQVAVLQGLCSVAGLLLAV